MCTRQPFIHLLFVKVKKTPIHILSAKGDY